MKTTSNVRIPILILALAVIASAAPIALATGFVSGGGGAVADPLPLDGLHPTSGGDGNFYIYGQDGTTVIADFAQYSDLAFPYGLNLSDQAMDFITATATTGTSQQAEISAYAVAGDGNASDTVSAARIVNNQVKNSASLGIGSNSGTGGAGSFLLVSRDVDGQPGVILNGDAGTRVLDLTSGTFHVDIGDDGAKNKGIVALNADGTTASTVTVIAGSICIVQDENAGVTEPAHSVTSTTLTITNNAINKNHIIDYLCY